MDIQNELHLRAKTRKNHQDKDVRVIHDCDLLDLATNHGLTPRQVFTQSLKTGIFPLRYLRNADSIVQEDQIVLAESCVAVVGAGGLGGHTIEYLARLGVGELRIFDPDCFDETNLNRQAFASHTTLGYLKVQAARDACRLINPGIDVLPHPIAIRDKAQAALFEGVQVIVDALDSSVDRLILADIARQINAPMVHGAVAGFEGRILVVLPGDDRLAKLFGDENENAAAENILGTPVLSPALIASFQVMSVLNLLIREDDITGHRMIHIDMKQPSLDMLSL